MPTVIRFSLFLSVGFLGASEVLEVVAGSGRVFSLVFLESHVVLVVSVSLSELREDVVLLVVILETSFLNWTRLGVVGPSDDILNFYAIFWTLEALFAYGHLK